jgi:hypothetical protein
MLLLYDRPYVVCILDALDECVKRTRDKLINSLKAFYLKQDTTTGPLRLKFFITSRPYVVLEASFRGFSDTAAYVRFDGDDKSQQISQEISLVIDARVRDIADGFTPQDRRTICDRLKRMEHRTYRWLHLTLDIITQNPSEYGRRADIDKLLSELPSQGSRPTSIYLVS